MSNKPTSEVPELKPCPFSHRVIIGVALHVFELTTEQAETIGGAWVAYVECYDCQAKGAAFQIDNRGHRDAKAIAVQKAQAAWNTRVDTVSPPADDPRLDPNLCDPYTVALDIIQNSTDPEHMQVRIEAELNRWKDAYLSELRKARATAPSFGVWQPIERAPKDGTWLLFYTPEDTEIGWLEFIAESFYDKHGELNDAHVAQWQDGMEPTHWMPRPPAPPITTAAEVVHSFNPTGDPLGAGLCVECGKPGGGARHDIEAAEVAGEDESK